jgi:hypothetical protein
MTLTEIQTAIQPLESFSSQLHRHLLAHFSQEEREKNAWRITLPAALILVTAPASIANIGILGLGLMQLDRPKLGEACRRWREGSPRPLSALEKTLFSQLTFSSPSMRKIALSMLTSECAKKGATLASIVDAIDFAQEAAKPAPGKMGMAEAVVTLFCPSLIPAIGIAVDSAKQAVDALTDIKYDTNFGY